MVTYETARESLQRAGVCCESMAQFRYQPLAEGEGVRFNLDASSTAFLFDSGKSYFKAFRLPGKTLPYRIKVTSFALGETIDKAHIFNPQVALLDDRFATVGQSAPGDFSFGKAGFTEAAEKTWGLGLKIEGSVLVDNPRARYVVIFTTPQLMRGTIPYETRRAIPVIVPGLVTAIPGGKEIASVRYSPFALLHVAVVPAGEMACPQGRREADIEPKDAIIARLTGRDARLFVSAVEPAVEATVIDAVVILRGPDVLGGTVAMALKDGCGVAHKFLSALDYIHAMQVLAAYRALPVLKQSERVELAAVKSLAEAGEPAAQFHVGLMYAWGRGVSRDRRASIEWLQRAAQRDFGPAMLALGMALSGPGVILDEAKVVGKPMRTDEFTDRVLAYSWLNAASLAGGPDVKAEAAFRLRELTRQMSPDELRRAKARQR